MKINDSSSQRIDPRLNGASEAARPQEARSGGPANVPAPAAGAPASGPASPAASINVASSAVALHAAVQDADPLSDTALLDQIKARVERGEMEFDYGKIANALIDDALAAAGPFKGGRGHGA